MRSRSRSTRPGMGGRAARDLVRRWRHFGAVAVAVVAFSSIWLMTPQPTERFGTINGLGQRAEHERITRAALACPPGVQSTGNCFEPRSIDQLAGHTGTFGAVGAPDSDEFGAPDTAGSLRADRLGGDSGRIYTLTYAATDAAGNSGTCAATVTVPHDQGQ